MVCYPCGLVVSWFLGGPPGLRGISQWSVTHVVLLCLGFWEVLLVSGGSPEPIGLLNMRSRCVFVSGRSSWSQEDPPLHIGLLHLWSCCVLVSGREEGQGGIEEGREGGERGRGGEREREREREGEEIDHSRKRTDHFVNEPTIYFKRVDHFAVPPDPFVERISVIVHTINVNTDLFELSVHSFDSQPTIFHTNPRIR